MWAIVKWKRWDVIKEVYEIFYDSVPETWICYNEKKPQLMWPRASKSIIEKHRKEGLTFNGDTERSFCTVLKDHIPTYQEATKEEKIIYDKEKFKDATTTEADSDNEAVPDSSKLDFNLMFDSISNKENIVEKSSTSNNDTGETNEKLVPESGASIPAETQETQEELSYGQLANVPIDFNCENCKYNKQKKYLIFKINKIVFIKSLKFICTF